MEEPLYGFDEESRYLAEKYEKQQREQSRTFFDTDEYESIVDYYIQAGKPKKAGKVLEQAMSQHPYSVTLLLKKAELLTLNQKFEEALEILEEALLFEQNN